LSFAAALVNASFTVPPSDEQAIPVKYTELITVAVLLTTPCPYCIDSCTARLVRAGTVGDEIPVVWELIAALSTSSRRVE